MIPILHSVLKSDLFFMIHFFYFFCFSLLVCLVVSFLMISYISSGPTLRPSS